MDRVPPAFFRYDKAVELSVKSAITFSSSRGRNSQIVSLIANSSLLLMESCFCESHQRPETFLSPKEDSQPWSEVCRDTNLEEETPVVLLGSDSEYLTTTEDLLDKSCPKRQLRLDLVIPKSCQS